MSNVITHKDIACKRLRSVGLTQTQTLSILNTIQKWNRNNGSDWTIKRLKEYKVAYIHKLAGKRDFWNTEWIAHHKDSPKGAFRPIFTKLGKKPQKALSALMVYTQSVSNKITKTQWNKFITGVEADPPTVAEEQVVEKISNLSKQFIRKDILKDRFNKTPYDDIELWYSRETRTPLVEYKYSKGDMIPYTTSIEMSKETFKESLSHPLVQSICSDTYSFGIDEEDFNSFREEYKRDPNLAYVLDSAAFAGSDEDFPRTLMGRIGFIQEPGAKLRSVSNPFQSIQFLSSKLGNLMYKVLDEMEGDYTHNQEAAVTAVQDFWKQEPDAVISSIDLSSATDLFPLSYQLEMLRHAGIPEHHVNVFEYISRGNWDLPSQVKQQFGKEKVSWTRGQPLGLYPSFAVFAFSHNLLAQSVKPKFYAIVGDDIMIDAEAGERLRTLYKGLGCKISEDKSITSNSLAEFAGKLITHDRTYIQPKWKRISDFSFIELARNLGPKSKGLFRHRQRKILSILDPIPKELSPFGLGWNSQGLSYDKRIEYFNKLKDLLEKESSISHVDQIGRDLSDLKTSVELSSFMDFSYKIDRSKENKQDLSFEEALLAHVGVHRVHLSEDDYHPALKSFLAERSQRTGDPRGSSTLETIERKLKGVDSIGGR